MAQASSNDRSRGVRAHPGHKIDAEAAAAMARMQANRDRRRAAAAEWRREAMPTRDERRRADAATALLFGGSLEEARKIGDGLAAEYTKRVSGVAPVRDLDIDFGVFDIMTDPADHHFWWAETEWTNSGRGVDVDMLEDGVHFFGRVSYDGDDLIQFSASARALFELQPARIPPSPSGRYNSEPTVFLHRGIDGATGLHHWLIAADDKWCKCRMSRRQTIYQFGLGQYAIRAERTETQTLIDEENNFRSVRADLPGAVEMPAVQFAAATNHSIWAELEVRFDIELEGSSFIGFSPEQNSAGSVLWVHPQWRPIAA